MTFSQTVQPGKPSELWVQEPYYFNTLFLRPVRNQHFTQKSRHLLLNPTSSREGRSSSSADPLPVTVFPSEPCPTYKVHRFMTRHTNLLRFAFFSQSLDVPTGSSPPCDCVKKKRRRKNPENNKKSYTSKILKYTSKINPWHQIFLSPT